MKSQPNGRRAILRRSPAALRLLEAERSEAIFPILLEEIVELGHARAMVLDVDFDTGEITPSAALKWPQPQTAKFASQVWSTDSPISGVLNSARPAAFPKTSIHNRPLYVHPIFYSNKALCWEAERVGSANC